MTLYQTDPNFAYLDELRIEQAYYKWFDTMWDDMVNFSKEHPNHIFLPADDPKNREFGFYACWEHPKPGYFAHELPERFGIDISDINFEKGFTIKVDKYRDTYTHGRFPKELLDLWQVGDNDIPYFSQSSRLELSRRIVKIAKSAANS